MKLLIVEDEKALAETIRAYLSDENYFDQPNSLCTSLTYVASMIRTNSDCLQNPALTMR